MSRGVAGSLACCALACIVGAAAAADAPDRFAPDRDAAPAEHVYESIDEIEVGRVFLSRAERQRLDRLRGRVDAAADPGSPAPSAMPPDGRQGAGYILRQSGPLRVWRDGDFVRAGAADAVETSFPGEIRIVRHPAPGDAADGEQSVARGDPRDDTDGS